MKGARRRRGSRVIAVVAAMSTALLGISLVRSAPTADETPPQDKSSVKEFTRSMEAKDVKPSRLGAATAAVRLFLDKVPSRLQIGLIAFEMMPEKFQLVLSLAQYVRVEPFWKKIIQKTIDTR